MVVMCGQSNGGIIDGVKLDRIVMLPSCESDERDCVSLPNINVLEEIKTFNQPILSALDPRRRALMDIKPLKAVQARSVTYTIGKKDRIVNILNRTNMTVPLGMIYSLLGPSGCGKTTLLRCVIGCLKPHKGLIRVFGFKPGGRNSHIPGPDVGYMPQEFALYDDLTIEETLKYFGRIYFMKDDLLQQRIDHLIEIMELPDRSHIIKKCSGGQKRRVSFACSLIHKPKLLLLDEPTVGVDPILRTRIWDILIHFTEQERMTVIITTHYIEETRRSHMIGFMRRGHILAEDSPTTLIRRYHVNNLEDVFYKLCAAQKRQSKLWKRTSSRKHNGLFRYFDMAADIDDNHNHHFDLESNGTPNEFGGQATTGANNGNTKNNNNCKSALSTHPNSHWYTKLNAVTRKILIQSIRQPSAIFAQFILPFISLLLFCVCIGGTPKNVEIGVVNLENPIYLSEKFLEQIDTSILRIRNESDLEVALNRVKHQQLMGVLYFEPNFSDSLIQRTDIDQLIDSDVVESSTIKMYADLSNKVLLVTIMRSLDIAVQKFLQNVSEDLGFAAAFFKPPIRLEEVIFGEFPDGDYFAIRQYGVPGILIVLTYSCAFGLTLMVLTVERARQMFERNFVAGVTTTHIILGHLIARVVFMSFNVIILFFVALFLFDVPCKGSPYEALGILLSQCVAGLTHGMMVSSMCPEFYMQAVISNGMLLTMFILSGALWPLESLPVWLKHIGKFSPTTIPTESLRSVLTRGLDYTHPLVYAGFIVSTVWSIVFFFFAVILFNKTQKAKD